MALEFTWDPNLFSIAFSALWVFRDVLLVIWAVTTMKRKDKPKFTSLLFVAGILLSSWNAIAIFLPDVGFSLFPTPDEAEFDLFITITFLFFYIPIVLEFILAVIFVIFFFSATYRINKKSLIGPLLFLLGNMIYICFHAIAYSILLPLDIYDYLTVDLDFLIMAEYVTSIIAELFLVLGFSFIFIYSIYRNDVLFTMYCGLYFAILLVNLFRITNSTLINFYTG